MVGIERSPNLRGRLAGRRMMEPLRFAVIGAGLIGRQRAKSILARSDAILTAVVDTADAARAFAVENGVPWFPSVESLLGDHHPAGAIVATPNQLHREHALACIAAKLPVLVEKPLADSVVDGRMLVVAARKAGVPVLVGQHRRYSASLRRPSLCSIPGCLGPSFRSTPRLGVQARHLL